MQTFLPYPEFEKSARVLDNRRLGKQRVECLQILRALYDPNYGWQNHPAVIMWIGCSNALCNYGQTMCLEWKRRGFKDTVLEKLIMLRPPNQFDGPYPKWLGDEAFHASHRSNLLRKDPAHYSQFGWTEPNNLPYIWPV
ncbi:hypothetical protein [Caudoviricetes sp.]|nr:hypothetical protein [Caudoviricetes sp.]